MANPAEKTSLATGLGQIAVPVHDVERATAFYRDILGLEHLFSAPPGLAFFRAGGVRIMLSRPEDPGLEPPGSILYFTVDDPEAAHARLAAAGVAVERPPQVIHRTGQTELRMGFYRDPEGNLFATMHEGPARG